MKTEQKKKNILEIKRLRLLGFTIKEIGEILDKTESQIKGICSYYGILKNTKKETENLLSKVNLNEYIRPKTFTPEELKKLDLRTIII